MGGMGFIENNKAECMQSVLINTNLLIACKEDKVKKYFFSSSACAYNKSKQQDVFIEGLKEQDAYPADPEDGYGWEKLFSERMCRHFMEDYGIEVRIARYHNIYGPFGTYDGGREKAPAALCRKIINAKKNNDHKIDVWGDGEQTRSFLYIDDCIEGTIRLFESDYSEPVNIGSDEQVSINQMIRIIEGISGGGEFKKNYQLDKKSLGSLHDWSHAGRIGNWLTINGKKFPEYSVSKNGYARLRFINASNARILSFGSSLNGMKIISIDGMSVEPFIQDKFDLGPGQRIDLLIKTDDMSTIDFFEVSSIFLICNFFIYFNFHFCSVRRSFC